MQAPALSADFSRWAEDVDQRLRTLEGVDSPKPAYACTKAKLPPAAAFVNCIVRITDLNILAASDGANWIRQDTGAVA